jgi:hypothetical protein
MANVSITIPTGPAAELMFDLAAWMNLVEDQRIEKLIKKRGIPIPKSPGDLVGEGFKNGKS